MVLRAGNGEGSGLKRELTVFGDGLGNVAETNQSYSFNSSGLLPFTARIPNREHRAGNII